MNLKKIILINFKTYDKLEFDCNSKFNIIIGENNIGKSTIYDALLLWNLAYLKLIKKNRTNFYSRKSQASLRINFTEFLIFRLVEIEDLFNDKSQSAIINLIIEDMDRTYELSIELKDIANSYITFNTAENSDFKEFSDCCDEKGIKLADAINIKLTKPISSLLRHEPFLNKAQIDKKTYLGFPQEALRNKILTTIEDRKFGYLQTKLENILGTKYIIRFKNNNREDDEFIDMTIQKENSKETDLLLVGSGVLHVLEIFSTLKNEQSNEDSVNLLLLDEPDSHIHADIQSKLIDELKSEDYVQTFLITHNDRLMQKADDGELFYICEDTKRTQVLNSLSLDNYEVVSQGLSALLYIEDEKPIILTEGKTDKKLIEVAWNKLNPGIAIPYHIVSPGVNTVNDDERTANADSVRRALEYASTFLDKRIIGLFDNDREGRERFNGLSRNLFSPYNAESNSRKHLTKDIWGVTLPVPQFRLDFITENSITQRYFVIEHYFENEILEEFNMKGEKILTTDIFEIQGRKDTFTTRVSQKPVEAFNHFEILFNKLNELLEIDI